MDELMQFLKKMIWSLVVGVIIAMMVTSSFAADLPKTISLNFDRVPVVQFIEATYKNILSEQYVIDSRLVDFPGKVTIQVKDLETSNLKPFLSDLLKSNGILIDVKDNITYFVPYVPGSEQKQVLSSQNVSIPGVSGVPGHLPGVFSPGQNSAFNSLSSASNFEIYKPVYRSVDQLQVIANGLLGTTYKGTEFVILAGSEKRVEMVRTLLEQYDSRPAEVLVRAVVYEFTSTDADSVNVSGALSVLAGKLNISIGASNILQNAISFKNTSLTAVVSAVAGDSRFNLVSSPTIRVLHGVRARLTVGSESPVLDSVQMDKNGNAVQSVTYRPSGVILDIQPLIMADRIELDLNQEVSSFTTTQTSTINSPTLLKRSLKTTVGVDPGELIVLGGLDEDKSNASRNGLIFMPEWLRFRAHDASKTQILMVLEVQRLERVVKPL